MHSCLGFIAFQHTHKLFRESPYSASLWPSCHCQHVASLIHRRDTMRHVITLLICWSCSPLIKTKHCIRLHHSKFEIKQQKMASGSLIAPWNDSGDTEHEKMRSFYDPIDLFSPQKERVERSIGDLTDFMTNNLRLWYESEMIFGYSLDGPIIQVSNDVINNIFLYCRETIPSVELQDLHDCILDGTNPIVRNILVHDVFLDKLKHSQHLDVISDDGAEEIYKFFSLSSTDQWMTQKLSSISTS